MQQSYRRERLNLTRQVQALKHELAVERRKNEKLRAACEGKNNQSPRGEQGCNQECEQGAEQAPEQAPGQTRGQAPEQLSTDRCDTQAEITDTKWLSEQSVEATTLRYRRLGRAALVGSLTVDTQRCTPLPQDVVESVEDGCGSDKRKRAKRSRRTEPPFKVSNNTTASR
ncbi:hypothetical protein E8E12_001423 [Didymella heteroderae]|uniref:Uncharacterized protein n=1 Tax=Didymella heteroderae TaxID=1769908 RepID=A0A9P5BW34_9PLEO|nr:hypothetical protein E8E12_001423 [Didymella heteroderae]